MTETATEWTDELRQEVIEEYKSREPTSENTMEIVKELAEEFGKSPNGIRVILTRANEYIKKEAPKKAASTSGGSGTKRVSKASAIERLEKAISANSAEVDKDIVSKLTGKAALYFAEILEANVAS